MTSKEFRMWLEGFLTNLNLDNMNIRSDINPGYNSLTMPPNPFEIIYETKK